MELHLLSQKLHQISKQLGIIQNYILLKFGTDFQEFCKIHSYCELPRGQEEQAEVSPSPQSNFDGGHLNDHTRGRRKKGKNSTRLTTRKFDLSSTSTITNTNTIFNEEFTSHPSHPHFCTDNDSDLIDGLIPEVRIKTELPESGCMGTFIPGAHDYEDEDAEPFSLPGYSDENSSDDDIEDENGVMHRRRHPNIDHSRRERESSNKSGICGNKSSPAVAGPKRILNSLTITEKFQIIQQILQGKSQADIVSEVPGAKKSTVSRIWKNREIIQQQFHDGKSGRKRFKKATKEDVESALIKWIKNMTETDKQENLNTMMCILQAETFAKELGHSEWKCTSGWFDRFKKRNNISFRKLRGIEESNHSSEMKETKLDPYN